MIDTSATAANGAMVEVEPDLVMYVYGGSYTPAGYRSQLFRVGRTPALTSRAVLSCCTAICCLYTDSSHKREWGEEG